MKRSSLTRCPCLIETKKLRFVLVYTQVHMSIACMKVFLEIRRESAKSFTGVIRDHKLTTMQINLGPPQKQHMLLIPEPSP